MAEETKTPGDWLQAIQDLSEKLTLARIGTILLTGILATFVMIVFENRDAIFQTAYRAVASPEEPSNWGVSSKSQEELTAVVRNSGIINFIAVTEVDLQKNKRFPRWWFLEDALAPEFSARLKLLLPQPVFDYDPKNTRQMVAVLNNELVCSRFQDTSWNRFFPDLAKISPVICRLAIPPFYGRFVGILTFGLDRQPTRAEVDLIRLEASRLAVEIYLRDVMKKPVS